MFLKDHYVLFTDVSKMKEIEDMQKQFLSDVSHELKTPMSAIIGSVEILKRDGLDSPEIFQEFMDILLKESYRMQNIINDILELSRLSNFISNAIKYSNDGVITIKTKKENNMFVLSVQDEGMGIPKNKLNYIYDRFYQVDKSRSSKISTGLGLSIVKKIVELNQGTIDVESTLGIGSTFTVKLPINPKVSHNEDII